MPSVRTERGRSLLGVADIVFVLLTLALFALLALIANGSERL